MNQSPIIYKGFNTSGSERTHTWALFNIDLVKRDLLNHFMTPKGARVMRPDWGCDIWKYLFDPFDTTTRNNIINSAMDVIKSEPRVRLITLDVLEYEQGIRLEFTCEYLVIGVVDTMAVNFDRSTITTWGGGGT